MKIRSGTREDLVGALAQVDRFTPSTLSSHRVIPDRIGADCVVLVWAEESRDGDGLPDMIAVAGDVREFLAWVNTYLPAYSPISALCRVTTLDIARRALEWRTRVLESRVIGIAVSMAIVEATISHWRRKDIRRPSLTACCATLSFVLAQSLIRGVDTDSLIEVLRSWKDLRRAVDSEHSVERWESIECPWGELLRLGGLSAGPSVNGDDPHLTRAARELFKEGAVSMSVIQEVADDKIPKDLFVALHESDREARVEAFESLSERWRNTSLPVKRREFLVGYAASRIAPGTFEHLQLLRESGESNWSAGYWYAFAASSRDQGDTWNLGGVLARRLRRQIETAPSWCEVAAADISMDELFIAMRVRPVMDVLISAHVNELWVELLPGVITVTRWPPRNEGSRAVEQQRQLALPAMEDTLSKTDSAVGELLKDIDHVLAKYRTSTNQAGTTGSKSRKSRGRR